MLAYVFNVALGAAAVYFFYQANYLAGVALLAFAFARMYQHKLHQFAKGLAQLTKYSELEKKSNCFLQLTIGIDGVLKHDAVPALFEKLQSTGTIAKEITQTAWTAQLLKNFRQKYKTDTVHSELKFNIKNNLLWKNGEIDFIDSIYHEIFIPYDDPSGATKITTPPGEDFHRKLETSFESEGIHAGLTIRAFMVNGIIKLQLGKFSKRLRPEVIKKGLDVYRTWETITSFPLLYFSYQHRIPEHYLNLSAYATDAWQSHNKGEKIEMTKDWKEVLKDVADYNYVCSVADEYVEERGRWEKIIAAFEAKRNPWLKREGFSDPFARDDKDDDYYGFRDNSVYYGNRYLHVYAMNYGDVREHRERYLYTDYYEERP